MTPRPTLRPPREATVRGDTTNDQGGTTIQRWSKELAGYLDTQRDVEHLRDRCLPEFPFPGTDNPMLAYLVQRSEEMAETDGRPTAVLWLAAHAWFEGALAALAAPSRVK